MDSKYCYDFKEDIILPRNKTMFFSAWLLIIVVAAYVTLQSPPEERDWYGYAGAMALIPFFYVFMGVIWAGMKAIALVPYLLVRGILDAKAPSRWYHAHSNMESLKNMFVWRDFSCFYIPDTIITKQEPPDHSSTTYRTKKEGKL